MIFTKRVISYGRPTLKRGRVLRGCRSREAGYVELEARQGLCIESVRSSGELTQLRRVRYFTDELMTALGASTPIRVRASHQNSLLMY